MAYQSKTYSLSDEVVAAIDAARAKGESPNKFLRRVLGIDKSDVVFLQREQRPTFRREDAGKVSTVSRGPKKGERLRVSDRHLQGKGNKERIQ